MPEKPLYLLKYYAIRKGLVWYETKKSRGPLEALKSAGSLRELADDPVHAIMLAGENEKSCEIAATSLEAARRYQQEFEIVCLGKEKSHAGVLFSKLKKEARDEKERRALITRDIEQEFLKWLDDGISNSTCRREMSRLLNQDRFESVIKRLGAGVVFEDEFRRWCLQIKNNSVVTLRESLVQTFQELESELLRPHEQYYNPNDRLVIWVIEARGKVYEKLKTWKLDYERRDMALAIERELNSAPEAPTISTTPS